MGRNRNVVALKDPLDVDQSSGAHLETATELFTIFVGVSDVAQECSKLCTCEENSGQSNLSRLDKFSGLFSPDSYVCCRIEDDDGDGREDGKESAGNLEGMSMNVSGEIASILRSPNKLL